MQDYTEAAAEMNGEGQPFTEPTAEEINHAFCGDNFRGEHGSEPDAAGDGDEPWLSLIEDTADIVTKELPPVVEIVEGIVAERSKLTIGSGSKSWKTWLTMDMALSVAHGMPFLGRATRRCRVLYVNLELKRETFDRRV